MRGIAQLSSDNHGLLARFLDPTRRLLRILVLGEVRDQYIGALARVSDRDGTTDPGVAAGDHGALAFELPAAVVTLLSVVGSWPQFGGRSGRRLLLGWWSLGHAGRLADC